MDLHWREQVLSNGNVDSSEMRGTTTVTQATVVGAATTMAPPQPTIVLPSGTNTTSSRSTSTVAAPVLVPVVLNNGSSNMLATNPTNIHTAPCILVAGGGVISEHHRQQQQQQQLISTAAALALQPQQAESHLPRSLECHSRLLTQGQQWQLQQQHLANEMVRRQDLLLAQQQAEFQRANILNSAVYLEILKKQNNEKLQALQSLQLQNQNISLVQNRPNQPQPNLQQIVANGFGCTENATGATTTTENGHNAAGGALLALGQPIISLPAAALTTDVAPAASPASSATAAIGSKNDGDSNKATSETTDPVPSAPSDKVTIDMSAPTDDTNLSLYQCMLRKQIIFFEASKADIALSNKSKYRYNTNAKILKQVGVQCKYCSVMPQSKRGRGSTFYPGTLSGIYQASQNMATTHFLRNCPNMPWSVKNELDILSGFKVKSSPVVGGKNYWAQTAKKAGIYEKRDDEVNPSVQISNSVSVVDENKKGPKPTGTSRLYYRKPEDEPEKEEES